MTLLLVDGSNIFMRAAFGGDIAPDQSSPIAIGIIERAARELNATHLIVALDDPGTPTWRKLEYPEYKANRTRDTSDWIDHGLITLQDRGIRVEQHPGYEADDVIATVALRSGDRTKVMVLSNDSDLLPLTAKIEPSIEVVRPLNGGEFQRFAASDVIEKYQIPAAHLLWDYKAMVGETTDNIPGVPGIGMKKAAALLHKFPRGLEDIIHAGAGGYSKESALVAQHAAAARRALRLVSLRPDVPVPPIVPSSCSLRRPRAA